MPDPVKFAVGGPVQVKEGTYLARPADEALFKACQDREFAYVLASRQIGKSSLMYETAKRLRREGVRTALIDLNGIGRINVEASQWYFSLIDELAQRLELTVDLQSWWEKRPPLSTPIQRYLEFLRKVVLDQISTPIVIFIDEIDETLGLNFTDDFFAAIRLLHNDRAQYPAYRRLTFVLLGAATPDELIEDNSRTPFNIGQAIALGDFTGAECEPFRQAVEAAYPNRKYFDQAYDWTAGHPYLTQKLIQAILNWSQGDQPELVTTLVTRLFLAPAERADDNLQFIQSRIVNDRHALAMLKIYKQVLHADEPVYDDEKSPAINRLKFYGLVVVEDDRLKIRNKLYARAFDLAWTHEMMEKSTRLALGLPRRYRVIQEIDRGGFATIYLAETTLDSGQTENVALKVLNLREESEYSAAKLIKRFEREAAAISRLVHPNIIRIRETGRSETGRGDTLFIAMEYIAGGAISTKLKEEGPLRRDEAVWIVKQIGAALGYAHEHDIIHRDVKPGNILLDTSQEPVRSVLTDFGLAKTLSPDDDQTSTGVPLGTARYMAPEQLAPNRWKQPDPTPATDIYALAIMFFEMLAGEHPYDAYSDHKLTGPELAEKHLNEPLPSIVDIVPEIGLSFDEVLKKATAKNPAERYQSVAQFVEALEAANDRIRGNRAARLVEVATDYVRDGDPDTALEMVERALRIFPEHVDALRLRGKIYFEWEQPLDTLENYRLAFEQGHDPASPAGRDYLKILRYMAKDAWQKEEIEQTIEHYQIIQQILDAGRAAGVSVQDWAEARTELVANHHAAGCKIYTEGDPEDLKAAIKMLRCEIMALKSLKAAEESDDLEKRVRHLQIKRHYFAAKKAYAAGSPENIGMAIGVLANKIHALEELGAAPERKDLAENLRFLRIKDHWGIADRAYAAGKPENIADAIDILSRQIQALEGLGAERESKELQEKRKVLRIKHHYGLGNQAYAGGRPENVAEAIDLLRAEIQALEKLQAEPEGQDLSQKLKQLQIRKHRNIIEAAAAAIEVNTDNESIFRHYDIIDEAYQSLIELEPENKQWRSGREEKLREQVKHRRMFARGAESGYHYEVALRHYGAIHDIKQTKKYDDIAQVLNLDLEAKIAELEEKAAYDRKYQEINKLVDAQEYASAYNQLVEDFIKNENYEHREIAKLLWGLVYARQNDWKYPPPEWVSDAELNATREQLAEANKNLSKVNAELVKTQNQMEVSQKELQYFAKQRKINKYVIPLSLILAVAAGGIIVSQLQNLLGRSIIMIIASVLLIAYFLYYIWVYYVSWPRHE